MNVDATALILARLQFAFTVSFALMIAVSLATPFLLGPYWER